MSFLFLEVMIRMVIRKRFFLKKKSAPRETLTLQMPLLYPSQQQRVAAPQWIQYRRHNPGNTHQMLFLNRIQQSRAAAPPWIPYGQHRFGRARQQSQAAAPRWITYGQHSSGRAHQMLFLNRIQQSRAPAPPWIPCRQHRFGKARQVPIPNYILRSQTAAQRCTPYRQHSSGRAHQMPIPNYILRSQTAAQRFTPYRQHSSGRAHQMPIPNYILRSQTAAQRFTPYRQHSSGRAHQQLAPVTEYFAKFGLNAGTEPHSTIVANFYTEPAPTEYFKQNITNVGTPSNTRALWSCADCDIRGTEVCTKKKSGFTCHCYAGWTTSIISATTAGALVLPWNEVLAMIIKGILQVYFPKTEQRRTFFFIIIVSGTLLIILSSMYAEHGRRVRVAVQWLQLFAVHSYNASVREYVGKEGISSMVHTSNAEKNTVIDGSLTANYYMKAPPSAMGVAVDAIF
ncbi:hypothetical protein TELCIR_04158 [Teladorsagia circumcincta]|uniref:EGF-like domain-containing protein n=1 Tax=Teladorsagia circumcincta TaxID=45464 RepID=A0A2G9UUD3_TELCI|nr:hypothetical protein TELCIR_04158 [Teladorsagia circumcincta]